MVQYLYALDCDNNLVKISDVTKDNRERYHCLSCGMEMSAVLGNKIEHHFRHKGDECSRESYLHKLSKLLLKERFDKSPTFEISYYIVKGGCSNECCSLRDKTCEENLELFTLDLKKDYNHCEIEGSYKGFRADVKLSDTRNPDRKPIFLEIYVKHKCSNDKIASGIQIIEIPVKNEDDVLKSFDESRMVKDKELLSDKDMIKFHNFPRQIYPKLSLFYVYEDKNGVIQSKIIRRVCNCTQNGRPLCKNALFEMHFKDDDIIDYIRHFFMFKAIDNQIYIKDCRICWMFNNCLITIPQMCNGKLRRKIVRRTSLKDLRYIYAHSCPRYGVNQTYKKQIFNRFKKLKYCIVTSSD